MLPQVLRAIRRKRGLRSSEVARAMGMALRSYQHFESGKSEINLDRIHQFADAVDADGYAIVLALDIGSIDFALYSLENKTATVLLVTLQRFVTRTGQDISRLDPRTLISTLDRAFGELTAKAKEYEAVLESWMTDKALGGDPPDEDE